VIAKGNVQHDYYQILIIPTLAFLFGLGIDFLWEISNKYTGKWITVGLILISSVFMLAFAWYQVRDYFNINNPAIVSAGQALDTIAPQNAKVIAPLDGDSSFLYQTHRQGWASYEHSLEMLITMGANYLVLVHPTQAEIDIQKKYKLVSQTPDYIIFNLNQKP
jgi:hypothetical protein